MSLYYQDEHVTLYHGDCLTDHREWLDADVLVTDPPYGIAWESHTGSQYRAADGKPTGTMGRARLVKNDNDTGARDEVLGAWGSGPAVVFGSWRATRPASVNHRLIWHKKGHPPGPLNAAFMSQDEEIYILGKGFRKSSPPLRSVIATTESRPAEVRTVGHPTPKPIPLMETLVDRCPPGVIADPFAGSGATLIAARNLGRKSIGVELEEKYCEIIAKRLDQQVINFEALA